MENTLPKRKALRLRYYDYNTPGAYFITFCTNNRRNILSCIAPANCEFPDDTTAAVGTVHEPPAPEPPHTPKGSAAPVGAVHEPPELKLTKYGEIAEKFINALPEHIGVEVDSYVIMPNHIHLMLIISDNERTRAIRESPLRDRSVISNAVGYIKMNVSRELKSKYGESAIWQRGYHDHIVRDKRDYDAISKYISENPLRWELDCFYTE